MSCRFIETQKTGTEATNLIILVAECSVNWLGWSRGQLKRSELFMLTWVALYNENNVITVSFKVFWYRIILSEKDDPKINIPLS